MSHTITLTDPPSHALTTLAAVKVQLAITDNSQDAKLSAQITRASAMIEDFLGRAIGTQTVTERWRQNIWYRRDFLPLALAPVLTVNSVVENTLTLTEDTDFEVEPSTGLLYRVFEGFRARWGYDIVVEYDTGWADVPPAIEAVCLDLISVAHLTALRDPSISLERTEGVGETRYFNRGWGTFAFDDAMLLALRPYMAITP